MTGTIIYYGGFQLPDKNASANRVVSNGKIFNELGFKTVFLGADYDGSFDGVHQINEYMFEECHPQSSNQWIESMVSFSNLKKLAQRYKNLSLVILYNVPFITLVLAKLYFQKQGIEVAYDCTEWNQATEGSVLKRAFKHIDEFFVRRFTHIVADRVIVISKMMESAYRKNKKLLRLPPLVDTSDVIWHQTATKDDKFTFCFAGFPGGDKEHLDKIVKAFIKIDNDNIRMNIVGLTEIDFYEMYPEFMGQFISSVSIDFKGVCSHEEAIKYILGSDCYIFIRPDTRRSNAGFPTKFAESYTCGVPIITACVSDIKDYQESCDRVYLLNSATTDEIIDVMKSVIDNSGKGKAHSLDNAFDYNNFIESTREWLNK